MNTNDHEDIENVTAHAALRAGRREWIGLAVIALPCLLYSMDLTVLELAVPKLSADLRPTSSQLLWILDIYGFLLAGFLITMGTLGDRIGRRRAARHCPRGIYPGAAGDRHHERRHRAGHGHSRRGLAPKRAHGLRVGGASGPGAGCSDPTQHGRWAGPG